MDVELTRLPGIGTDPAQIPSVLTAAIVLALVGSATKIATDWFAARSTGVLGPVMARFVEPVRAVISR